MRLSGSHIVKTFGVVVSLNYRDVCTRIIFHMGRVKGVYVVIESFESRSNRGVACSCEPCLGNQLCCGDWSSRGRLDR